MLAAQQSRQLTRPKRDLFSLPHQPPSLPSFSSSSERDNKQLQEDVYRNECKTTTLYLKACNSHWSLHHVWICPGPRPREDCGPAVQLDNDYSPEKCIEPTATSVFTRAPNNALLNISPSESFVHFRWREFTITESCPAPKLTPSQDPSVNVKRQDSWG